MSSSTFATANQNERLVPPEQRLWKRYSPHHELPLSAVSSVVLHVLGFLLIALVIGGFVFRIRPSTRLPEVKAVAIAPGAKPGGTDIGNGSSVLEEAVAQQRGQQAGPPVVSTAPPLKDISPQAKPLELDKEKEGNRNIDGEMATASDKLKKVQEGSRRQITGLPSGRRDPLGNDRDFGKPRIPQQKRQQRWTLLFNTRDGADYLRQLQALGAFLAIPQDRGQFLVIRDLTRRPASGQTEDISQIERIYWIDEKPDSVASLAAALGLPAPPQFIAAFFPKVLEDDLLEKERRHFHGPEDDIQETRFQVIRRGDTFEAVVGGVTSKTGRPGS